MHAAPPVSVVCTGGRAWRVALWLLPAWAVAALVAWASLHAGLTSLIAWALAVPAAAASAVGAARLLPPQVHLVWDGAQWRCQGVPVRVQVNVDLGPWVLLRLVKSAEQPTSPTPAVGAPCPRWVAVSRSDAGAAMHAFRAAVYCLAPLRTDDGSAPESPNQSP